MQSWKVQDLLIHLATPQEILFISIYLFYRNIGTTMIKQTVLSDLLLENETLQMWRWFYYLLRVLGLWESQGVEAQIREKQQSLGRRIIKLYYILFIRWTPCHCHVHDISVRILPEPLVMLLWTLSFCLFAVMLGVSQLSTRDITETSVTLVWTPPPVQYDSYHITFTSQVQTWLILIIWRCNRVSIPRDIIEVESCGHKAHGPCLSVIIRLFWCVLNSYIWSLLLLDVALQPKFKGEK